MYTAAEDWKMSTKHINDYKVTRLPRGDEYSHTEFQIDPARKIGSKRGGRSKEPTAEQLKQELNAKEEKMATGAITD